MSKRKRSVTLIKSPRYKIDPLICNVVTPFHNGFGFLKSTLDAIPDALGKYYSKSSVVLVDDQSDPAKLEEFYKGFPEKYKLLHTKKRSGYPGGCNLGANHIKGKYIAIITSDVVMKPGSVEKMIEDMEADETIGVIGPKLLFPETSSDLHRPAGKIQHAGLEMNIGANICHIFSGWSADHPKVNIKREPLALTGAMLLIRRTDWEKVGGFFIGYGKGTWEDVDLCFSIRYLGHKVVYEPEAVGYHYVGATVLEDKEGFDLRGNETLFKMRWGQGLIWTDWQIL